MYKIWWPEAVCYKRNSHTYFTFWKINIKDPAKQLWSGSDRCREESGEDGMEDRQGVEEEGVVGRGRGIFAKWKEM